MSSLSAGVAFTVIRFGGRRVRILHGLGCVCFGIALLFRRCFADIGMLGRLGFFELTLIMSVVRVSSAFSTFLSPTLVVTLDLLGVGSTLVGHVGPLGFGGIAI